MDINTADYLVQQRIEAAQNEALSLLAQAESKANDVITASYSGFGAGPISEVKKPSIETPKFYADTDLAKLFDDKYSNILKDLQGGFFPLYDELMAKYFPKLNESLNADMEKWLDDAILNGGVGIPVAIEKAIVQRAMDREMDAASIIKDQAVNEFAARGFPLPSGALASRFQQADLEAQRKISELNRDTAIAIYKERVETAKFAIQIAADLRKHADLYIKDLMLSYVNMSDTAAKIAGAQVEAYKALWAATAEYYRALTSIEGMLIDVDKFNNEMNYKLQELQFRQYQVSMQTRVSAATSVAQLYAQAAGSYLNAQNTIVQIASQAEYTSAAA